MPPIGESHPIDTSNPAVVPSADKKGRKFNFWKIGFFVETAIILAFVLLAIFVAPKESTPATITTLEATPFPKPELLKASEIASWKEYENPTFSFKYPDGWYIKETQYGPPTYFIEVENYPDHCGNCSKEELQNYYAFYIEDLGLLEGKYKTNNVFKYYLMTWLDSINEEDACRQQRPREACTVVPGISHYLTPEWSLFQNQTKEDVVFDGRYYFLINNYRLFDIALNSPAYPNFNVGPKFEDDDPIVEIVRSLKFKN